MSVFVVAISGGQVLGSAINAFLVARRTPPRFAHLGAAFSRVGHLAGSGAAFVIISLASLAETQGLCSSWPRLEEPERWWSSASTSVSSWSISPSWRSSPPPMARPDQRLRRRDHGWARATIRRTAALVLVGGLASGIIIGGFRESG